MHLSFKATVAVTMLLAGLSSGAAAQHGTGRVQGVVVDESGGVLPGVTVEAAVGGRLLAGSVTNAAGRYSVALPSGAARLTFSLEGFSAASVDVDVPAGEDLRLDAFRLDVAPRSETVVVRGDAPVAPVSAPPHAQLPPPPPPPVVIPLPEHDHDSVCGPAKAPATPESLGTITRLESGEHDNALYARDDQVVIDGGTLNGLAVGQNVVARRNYRPSIHMRAEIGEHTAGVLQIVRASEKQSVAVIVYACDEIRRGDRVAPFAPEPLRAPDPIGRPAFDDAAHILFGDAGQTLGAPRRFMVIDRGADQGIHTGQRLTLFRSGKNDEDQPTVVGDATVVAVRSDSATIRIERVSDAIGFGDGAAPQGAAAAARRQ